jgi:hypothetical protein
MVQLPISTQYFWELEEFLDFPSGQTSSLKIKRPKNKLLNAFKLTAITSIKSYYQLEKSEISYQAIKSKSNSRFLILTKIS